jgi:hypothetical protein
MKGTNEIKNCFVRKLCYFFQTRITNRKGKQRERVWDVPEEWCGEKELNGCGKNGM